MFMVVSGVSAQSDEAISLFNASFEGVPGCCKPPDGWSDCGFPNESPPDIQPSRYFMVSKAAIDGKTYMGMVTRANDTWESVQQRLERNIEKGRCYNFSLYLCRSDVYVSGTKANPGGQESFTTPIKLRIWGGSGFCVKKELLGESDLVKNTDWQKFEFRFEPDMTHQYIILEAFYRTPTLFPYNGNILIDKASDIVPVPCDEAIVHDDTDDPAQKGSKASVSKSKKPVKEEVRKDATASREPAKVLNLERGRIRKGHIIPIDKLYFEADSTKIPEACFPVLDEIYEFMTINSDIIIEIGGHTNGIPKDAYCDRLSLERAKSVAAYIANKGVPWRRLYYKGYGKRKPIADDSTADGKKKNQRVEIKILHMNG